MSSRSFPCGQMAKKCSKMDPSSWRLWSVVAPIWPSKSTQRAKIRLERHFSFAKLAKFDPNRQKVAKMSFLGLILDRKILVSNEALLRHFWTLWRAKTVYLAPISPRNTFVLTGGTKKKFRKIADFGQILKGLTHNFEVLIFGFLGQKWPKWTKWGSRLANHRSTNAPIKMCFGLILHV